MAWNTAWFVVRGSRFIDVVRVIDDALKGGLP